MSVRDVGTGLFGPQSMAWRVLSSPATALMIAQITNLLEVPNADFQRVLLDHDPLFATNAKRQRGHGRRGKSGHFHDRLRRTVGVPLPMIFGDAATATRTARRLVDFHRPMAGSDAGGAVTYAATDPDTMLFASVTIAHAGLIAYEKFSFTGRRLPRRLPEVERDQYFADMATIALLMGAPSEKIPVTASEVAAYYRSIPDKWTTVAGWKDAQRRTGIALLRPDGRADIGSTVADIVLMLSALLGFAALPKPSRRLNRVPFAADPVLRAIYLTALPLFALLRIPRIRRGALTWFLGPEDAAILEQANATPRNITG